MKLIKVTSDYQLDPASYEIHPGKFYKGEVRMVSDEVAGALGAVSKAAPESVTLEVQNVKSGHKVKEIDNG